LVGILVETPIGIGKCYGFRQYNHSLRDPSLVFVMATRWKILLLQMAIDE
jgi:hypothetical protein